MKPRIGITTTPRVHEDRLLEALDRANVTAIVQAGGMPLVLPVLDPDEADAAVACLDGLLLSGGGDLDPAWYGELAAPEVQGIDVERDAWEIALVRAARAHSVPVLGICRGSQVINVATGGTLIQHLPAVSTELDHCQRDRCATPVHGVRVLEHTLLEAAAGLFQLRVNSLHHQAIGAVGSGLRTSAWADDGTVEAVEGLGGQRVLGVQWHPELLLDEPGHGALFAWLVTEAARSAVPAEVAARAAMAADVVPLASAAA